jgi:hypothetical protein
MSNTLESLKLRARRYLANRYRDAQVEKHLGSGEDGAVWQTSDNTAIKVLERRRNYNNEVESYQRIQNEGIANLLEFTIPALVGFDDELLVVEMSFVSPPCLIDFGKVYFDSPPEYEEGTFEEDFQEKLLLFAPEQRDIVERLLWKLELIGIYYVDPKPANIRFANDPNSGD